MSDTYYAYIFPVLMVGLMGWQLKSGETFRMRFIPSFAKGEHPTAFWSVLLFQLGLTVFGTWESYNRLNEGSATEVAEGDSTAPVQMAGVTGGGGAPTPPPRPGATKTAPITPAANVAAAPRATFRDSAMEFHRVQKFAEAVPLYDAAIFQAPNDAELHYWRGVAHWNLSRNTQAVKDFRRAIDLDSLHFNAHVNITYLLTEERKYDEALHFWTKYSERVPKNGEAFKYRADLNKSKGDMNSARADAAKGCQLGNKEACAQVTAFKGMP